MKCFFAFFFLAASSKSCCGNAFAASPEDHYVFSLIDRNNKPNQHGPRGGGTRRNGTRRLTPFETFGTGTCTESLGCPDGQIAVCYFHDGSDPHYHSKCLYSKDLGGAEIGEPFSSDKSLAGCGPCSCLEDAVGTTLNIKPPGKSAKLIESLICPPPLVPVVCLVDKDDDGVPDLCDNCPLVANAGQEDADFNGVGDACSSTTKPPPVSTVCLNDKDGDGVPDLYDNCPSLANAGQEESYRGGVGLACCSIATLILTTDEYPEETFWALKELDGFTINSVPRDTYDGETIVDLGCLDPTDCYEFTIFDSYGDGLYRTSENFGGYSIEFDNLVYARPAYFIGFAETILIGACDCEPATLFLTTDNNPQDTFWELKLDGRTLASIDIYFYESANTLYETDLGCFDPTFCYEFTILDSSDDGLSDGGNGQYSIAFNNEVYAGPANYEVSETIFFGECAQRQLTETIVVEEEPHLQVHTTIVFDIAHVAELTVTVPYDQQVAVDVVDADSGALVAALFDGMISADNPQVVSFDLGRDIGTLKYKAEIQGENEADIIEIVLFNQGYDSPIGV